MWRDRPLREGCGGEDGGIQQLPAKLMPGAIKGVDLNRFHTQHTYPYAYPPELRYNSTERGESTKAWIHASHIVEAWLKIEITFNYRRKIKALYLHTQVSELNAASYIFHLSKSPRSLSLHPMATSLTQTLTGFKTPHHMAPPDLPASPLTPLPDTPPSTPRHSQLLF